MAASARATVARLPAFEATTLRVDLSDPMGGILREPEVRAHHSVSGWGGWGELDKNATAYCRAIVEWPDMAERVAAAKIEPADIEELDAAF